MAFTSFWRRMVVDGVMNNREKAWGRVNILAQQRQLVLMYSQNNRQDTEVLDHCFGVVQGGGHVVFSIEFWK